MAKHVVLSVEHHFESLRESVWVRFCARHHASDRERFEDLYAEWWARESERAAAGAPSRAAAPAAFIAEAVHHVLIDDARARARGLGRDAKKSLELVDLEDQLGAAAADDTAGAAAYETLVHRVLTLVRGRLTERETRVFVWSFLYLQPSETTARALGLTIPRVKKDRRRITAKIGEEVWAVLAGELDLCAAYDERSLPAIFELLTVHVEDCPVCSATLGGVRRGALAVVGPELIAVEASTHAVSGLADTVVSRIHGLLHRGAEAVVAVPPNGRTAAAVVVAATAVAGGAATVVPRVGHKPEPRHRHAQRAAPRPARIARGPAATAPPVATQLPHVAATAAASKPPRAARRRAPAPTVSPAREPISFERQAPSSASTHPEAAQTAAAPPPSTSSSSAASKEFGFEHP
jgi:DNA-directed RNA polymerase specialized sigma24 family protein